MQEFFTQIKTAVKNYLRQADLYLLVLALLSSGFGMVLIYSATRSYDTNHYMYIQLAALLIGLCAFIVISFIDIDLISNLWVWLFCLNLVLLASLAFLGVGAETVGNKSWIRFGPIGIQPAEIGKIIFIFTLSQHLSLLKDRLNRLPSIMQLSLHALITAAFVYVFSEDLGMTLAYLFIFVVMIFAAGLANRYIFIGAGLLIGMAPVAWHFLKGYQKTRILVIFNPSLDPDTAYHALQSQIALGAGQLTGRGFLQGRQTQYSILPTKHTDFIFSVAGEEFGFLGCMIVIGLLSLLILRIFYVAFKSSSDFSYLVCIGIGGMLLFQTFVNIGMCVGITPVIGLTLPLFSYGGSSMVTTFTVLGIVSGIRMRGRPKWL
ncbi:MAG: FtsW/RodA/SpoVE family cell cycle protein [Bacillota bacterium]|nr:FtsW/RodA/SpoVE family cell cycle protein [Bacillota bacterium]